jgi:RNA polymerase sigma-70 factor (ECF subfamily)
LAYSRLHQFEGRAPLSTWLGRVVINSARAHLRRRKAHTFQALEEIGPDGQAIMREAIVDPGPSPLELCARAELRLMVAQLLGRLPPHLRAVTYMRKIQELTIHEVCQFLNLKDGTVKCQLFRARVQLARLVVSSPGTHWAAREQKTHG